MLQMINRHVMSNSLFIMFGTSRRVRTTHGCAHLEEGISDNLWLNEALRILKSWPKWRSNGARARTAFLVCKKTKVIRSTDRRHRNLKPFVEHGRSSHFPDRWKFRKIEPYIEVGQDVMVWETTLILLKVHWSKGLVRLHEMSPSRERTVQRPILWICKDWLGNISAPTTQLLNWIP